VKERLIFGYDPFVLPFTLGMVFIILYLMVGTVRIILALDNHERKLILLSLMPAKFFKNVKDIILDCLIHVKIFKRNALLGYMHSSIAFGWFMLIFVGHIEEFIYTPQRAGALYYPVFFRYFVMETHETLKGSFFFFIMDLSLLVVLSGIGLAIFKRFRSKALGMRRTTKLRLGDQIAMYSLWAIFPLRLLAESFTADISGGSFLTISVNHLLNAFVTNRENILPVWWAYSCALSLFLFSLPFSRYMHIPTEMLLIILKNAGIKSSISRDGYAECEIYSCSRCGLCIDACPMTAQKRNIKFSSVYFIRLLRRRSDDSIKTADKCLMCNKCVEACPVEIDSTRLKLIKRQEEFGKNRSGFGYLKNVATPEGTPEKVVYYAGCMTHLSPAIYTSIFKILKHANIDFTFLDAEGSICCGRPLMLSGDKEGSKLLIEKNSEMIKATGGKILLLSCPICYKIFNEEYKLNGITVVHHSVFINDLVKSERIKLKKSADSFVFHDPCELGRGSDIYDQPRELLSNVGVLLSASKERKESICCGGSLGSLTLSYNDREQITKSSLKALIDNNPDKVVTACPLCLKSFSTYNSKPTKDIAQIVSEQLI